MNTHRIALICLGCILVAMGAMASSKKTDARADAAARAKSEYIYLEAQNAYNQENYSLYGRLLQRAFDTDSSDLALGAELARWQIVAMPMSPQEAKLGLQRARRYYEANPGDYYAGVGLAKTYLSMRNINEYLEITKLLQQNFPDKNDVALQLAEAYLRRSNSEDFDSAMAIYRRLEKGYDVGINNSITSYIISAYMLRSDTTAVLDELNKIYRAAPLDVPTLLTVGGSMLELNRPDSALRYFEAARDIEPDNGGVIIGYLGYYDQVGDSAAFLKTLRDAVDNRGLDPEEQFMFVRSYVQENHNNPALFETCCELCESYISNNPGTPEIHTLYAGLLNSDKRYDAAAEQLSFAIGLLPSELNLRLWQLSLIYESGDEERAMQLAEQYAADFPKEPAFARMVAANLYMKEKYKEAVERFRQFPVDSLENDIQKSEYYATLADFMSKLEPRSDSYPYYRKAIELNPQSDMAMNNLAYFYSLDGRPEDLQLAEQYSALAIRHQPENPTYLDTYAWVKFKQKDFQAARRYIDMVIELMELQQEEQVVDSMLELELKPDQPDSIGMPMSEVEEVIEAVESIEDENQASADVYDHAGDIYFMTGEPERALYFWQRALALEPDNELLQKKVKHKTYFYE